MPDITIPKNGPRRMEILRFLEDYELQHGYGPTYDEIRVMLKLASKSGVHRLLSNMRRDGLVTFGYNQKRSIKLVRRNCPHCGGAL